MKLTKFWVVSDPSPLSELADILFESDPLNIAFYITGTGIVKYKEEHHTFYTDPNSALRDAKARLQKVKKQAKDLTYLWGETIK